MTERPTVAPDPANPGQVLIHLPEFGYLDTQVWSLDVGVPAASLPALQAAISAHLAAADPGAAGQRPT